MRSLQAQLDHFSEFGRSITAFKTDTPIIASKGSSRVETAAVGIVDTLSALNENLRAYTAIVDKAKKRIEKIPQENYRLLLTYKYLCGMSFRSISDQLRYTDRNSVYRAHGWALIEMKKVLKAEEQNAGRLSAS